MRTHVHNFSLSLFLSPPAGQAGTLPPAMGEMEAEPQACTSLLLQQHQEILPRGLPRAQPAPLAALMKLWA